MNTKITKKLVIYLTLNGFFVYMLYLGIMNNDTSSMNVALAFSWLTVVCAVFLLAFRNNAKLKDEMLKSGRSVPVWVDIPFDIAIACALAYAGYAFLATLYILQIIISYDFWVEVEKYKKLKQEEQNLADENKNGIKF